MEGLNAGSLCLSSFICQTGEVTILTSLDYGKIRASVYSALHTEGTRNSHRINKRQALASSIREPVLPKQAQFWSRDDHGFGELVLSVHRHPEPLVVKAGLLKYVPLPPTHGGEDSRLRSGQGGWTMWLAAHNRSAHVTCNSQFSLVTKIAEVSWQLSHLYQVCIWPQHSIVGPFEPATFLFVQLTDPL